MYAICENCFHAPLLKSLVSTFPKRGPCSICLKHGARVVETSSSVFRTAVAALIRYHYSEWEYHTKLGGDGFEALLMSENPIIKRNPALAAVDYEDVLLSFLEGIVEETEIRLITAYGRAIYECRPMTAVSEGEAELIRRVTYALTKHNYFVVEERYQEQFRDASNHVAYVVEPGSQWFRARLGANRRAANIEPRPSKESYFYEPHAGSRIGAPPVGTTTAGRVNRPGVSYLYLATDADTAIAEVRPHPGELVSIGAFGIDSKVRVANLSEHDLKSLYRTDGELEILETIIAMERAFATAAPPTNRRVYSLTQFLAEMFRRLGFDGVAFKSTVGDGSNLVLFNPELASFLPKSSRVVEVARVEYTHEERRLYDPNGSYEIDFDWNKRAGD